MLWAVIMAGGKGERFWPKSREHRPKQLLPITSEKSMAQLTMERLDGLVCTDEILVFSNAIQVEALKKQIPLLPDQNFIAEPAVRDTAPCIGLAATLIMEKDPDAVMVVLPADHVIEPRKAFHESIQLAAQAAVRHNCLMTIGIKPACPAQGYGYLETGSLLDQPMGPARKVKRFVEKPNLATAKEYLAAGNYFWNSGIFIWQAKTVLAEIRRQMPELASGLAAIQEAKQNRPLKEVLQEHFPALPKQSIDYGIMEGAGQVGMIPAAFEWDDVGSWEALEKHFQADASGNICIGNVILKDCKNMLVYNLTSDNTLLATAIGQQDQVLVQTEDAVMVVPREHSQKVKDLVALLKMEKLNRFL